MPDYDDDEPIILQEGKPAEEKFKFSIEKHVLGRRIKGLSYCSSEEVDGQPKSTIRLDFDDGGFLVIAIDTGATDIDMWVQRENEQSPVKWKM